MLMPAQLSRVVTQKAQKSVPRGVEVEAITQISDIKIIEVELSSIESNINIVSRLISAPFFFFQILLIVVLSKGYVPRALKCLIVQQVASCLVAFLDKKRFKIELKSQFLLLIVIIQKKRQLDQQSMYVGYSLLQLLF